MVAACNEAANLPVLAGACSACQVEMAYRAAGRGVKIVEIPIHFSDRSAGESKMNLSASWSRP